MKRPEDQAPREPIAIVGIGCRLPGGADNPDAFWKLLRDGVDAVSEAPSDRWSPRLPKYLGARPGDRSPQRGGFLGDIDGFDAAFFGITPREAVRMDPQQRILLELTWEALEDAGLVPGQLAGSRTGVFVGVSTLDYGFTQAEEVERTGVDAYMNSGTAMCMVANRVSFAFDFRGPSFTLDAACSSSLVAVALACDHLWTQRCSLAVAGGVNLLLRPEVTLGFANASMLSPDGCCRSFDARADGYVRSEGAGVVILKPLSDALAARDPICAVILGAAVNQSGRGSGITVPSAHAQEAMLRDVYRDSGIPPARVDYIEAHGTGTKLGDPIEARAIGNVLGRGEGRGHACAIGSVKGNIGHLEAAAGIAGLIKAALCLRHRQIPPSPHFQTPNPEIPFEALCLRVPQTLEEWPEPDLPPRIAGVNSFGFGGTNAHIVLAEAPRPPEASAAVTVAVPSRAFLLPLSARSPEALADSARALLASASENGGGGVSLGDVCYTAAVRRSHHNYRLALVVQSNGDVADGLQAFLRGETRKGSSAGPDQLRRSRGPVFVFSGMGTQWPAMGQELFAEEDRFREVLEQCDDLFRGESGWSVLEALLAEAPPSRIHETQVAQPAIFCVQVALAALWRSWGIAPSAIVGHSVGEVAAAHVAGVLSLGEAIRVVFHRSRLQHRLEGQGTLLAVGLPVADVNRLLARTHDGIAIAAINSPRAVTLSGGREALAGVVDAIKTTGVFYRFLATNVPYHGPKMDPLKAELMRCVGDLAPQPAAVPLFSTVCGHAITGTEMDGAYWTRNMREPVQFAAAVEALLDAGHETFLEIGPHPVLATSISEAGALSGRNAAPLSSLRRGEPERAALLASLGELYTRGYAIEWNRLAPQDARFVRLPRYAWQRERFWFEPEEARRARLDRYVHPLLGRREASALPTWTARIELRGWLGYLADHRFREAVVFPGAAYVEAALAAARDALGEGPYELEDVEFVRACRLSEEGTRRLQTVLDPSQRAFDIYTLPDEGVTHAVRHAGGTVHRFPAGGPRPRADLDGIRRRCPTTLPKGDVYERSSKLGLIFGPAFQGIEQLWVGRGEALGRIRLSAELQADSGEYVIHPALLDACFQVLIGAISVEELSAVGTEHTYLPTEIERLRIFGIPRGPAWSHAVLRAQSDTGIRGDLKMYDEAGDLILEIKGFSCRPAPAAWISEPDNLYDHLYESRWEPRPRFLAPELRPRRACVPRPSDLRALLEADAAELGEDLGRNRFLDELEPLTRKIALAYIVRGLEQLGQSFEPGARLSLDRLAERWDLPTHHRRLLRLFCEILEQHGMLTGRNGEREVPAKPDLQDIAALEAGLWRRLSAYEAELTLLRRCGQSLPAVLRGEINPLEAIFPQGSFATAQHLYQDSPTFRFPNLLLQRAFSHIVDQLPRDRTVRILEVGAGTGSLTSYLATVLPHDQAEYVFTDVSPAFLTQAAETFSHLPFLHYRALNLDDDPLSQGFPPHAFDVIVASEVLHATRDLRRTLAHIKALLAPGGLLLFLEGTPAAFWGALAFGILPSFWVYEDVELRGSDPRLSRDAWHRLLRSAGFEEVESIADHPDAGKSCYNIVLAQGPAAVTAGESPLPAVSELDLSGRWLLFADSAGVARHVAARLAMAGAEPILVSAGEGFAAVGGGEFRVHPGRLDDMQALLAAVSGSDRACRGIVHCWSLDAPPSGDLAVAGLDAVLAEDAMSVVNLVNAVVSFDFPKPPQLTIVTRGAQPVGDAVGPLAVSQAPVWGLGRVIANEQPALRCKLVDLDPTPSEGETDRLVRELAANDQEDEIAIRRDCRQLHRVERVSLSELRTPRDPGPADGQALRADVPRSGLLADMVMRAVRRRRPGPGQVEIEVKACALNFKDLMVAMGSLPLAALEGGYTGRALGFECAGTVTALGEGVAGLAVGDGVIACGPGTLATHVIVEARFVLPKPAHLTYEEAATIPVAFSTAHYALHHLGHLRQGERVLIHSAAGGVGLAAVQIAQQIGAEIYATAGSAEKRDLLRAIGVRYASDSHSLGFVDDIRTWTGGRGVDVVLNSLAGEAMALSLGLLAPYGRFIEIGKQDIYANSRLGLRTFRKNLSFFAVDIDRMLQERPDFAASLTDEVGRRFLDRQLRPLPHRVFPLSRAVDAFQYMARGRHIGKIVVSFQNRDVSLRRTPPAAIDPVPVRPDGAYLVAGGLGGFGLAFARWLVERGAKHVILLGRGGAASPQARAEVDALRQEGADVVVAHSDVSREEDVRRVLAEAARTMPPLRGVVHAAMVLDDAPLAELDEPHLRRVLAPKAQGAWNLHLQTSGMPLDFFVMFSSISAVIGLPRQGNYAAANAFLEALAWHRRAQGLPALAVDWGLLGEIGHVARDPELMSKLEALAGVKAVTAREYLPVLSDLLARGAVHTTVARLNWQQLAAGRFVRNAPRFAPLTAGASASSSRAATRQALLATVLAAPSPERYRVLEEQIRAEIARVMRINPAKLDLDQPLVNLGLDSLMAVELKNKIESEFGIGFAPMEFVGGITSARLLAMIHDHIEAVSPAEPAAPERSAAAST